MRSIFILFFIILTSLEASKIRVAIAANVNYAIDELLKEFHKEHSNIDVKIILGSSGKLTAQISNGAPYDVFMSANMKYPNTLYENKIAITKPMVYALGSLAILSNKNIDLSKNIDILDEKIIKKIAIANPKTAPYGDASFKALKNAKIIKNVKSKIVYAESVSQTLSYTLSGATDVGLVAKSSLYSDKVSKFKDNLNWIELDKNLYKPIEQGIVLLKNSNSAKTFYDFILSKKAKKIFLNYGYQVK